MELIVKYVIEALVDHSIINMSPGEYVCRHCHTKSVFDESGKFVMAQDDKSEKILDSYQTIFVGDYDGRTAYTHSVGCIVERAVRYAGDNP
jgi:hypothetical protein